MELINCCFLIAISLAATKASVFGELGNNLLSSISKRDDSVEIKLRNIRREIPMKKYLHGSPIEDHVNQDEVQRNFAKAQTVSVNSKPRPVITKMPFKKDGVLNYIRRARDDTTASDEASSSRELVNWKTEWKKLWLAKKLEALNETDIHGGDKVNMVAARPWGVPCGDAYMHDMPWGSCVLAEECEAEFRIFRGDFKCGRTQFVCCAVQLTSYDMYQAFDNSFASSDFGTDSWEKKQKTNTKSNERRKKREDKRKRKRARQKRKKRIARNIKRIIKQINKILNKINRQGTKQRKKKTRLLKKFIKYMKKKYKSDRKSVKSIHLDWMDAIDDHTLNRLLKLKKMNQDFIKNNTFANIIVNGTLNYNMVRAMLDKYPEMLRLIQNKAKEKATAGGKRPRRRFMEQPSDVPRDKPEYLQYDIEYGLLYY